MTSGPARGKFTISISCSTLCTCHRIPMYFDHFLYTYDEDGDFTVFDCFPALDVAHD